MLTHSKIWTAIDALADRNHCSPSALAKKAGLDSTTFNPSKRISNAGKLRWPSTESLAKILHVTGTSLEDFAELATSRDLKNTEYDPSSFAPGFAEQGSNTALIAALSPLPSDHPENLLPKTDHASFALKICDQSMSPLYRKGDILVLSKHMPLAPHDRCVIKSLNGSFHAGALVTQQSGGVELMQIDNQTIRAWLPKTAIDWVARILWVSQ